jgi:predicted nucleic acid-binding protein
LGREWQRLNLAEYSPQHPIFIDANIFLDYALPNHLCYDAVDTFNEFIGGLDGLKLIPVQPEDHLRASDLGRAYNLLPIDALHLSAMRRAI